MCCVFQKNREKTGKKRQIETDYFGKNKLSTSSQLCSLLHTQFFGRPQKTWTQSESDGGIVLCVLCVSSSSIFSLVGSLSYRIFSLCVVCVCECVLAATGSHKPPFCSSSFFRVCCVCECVFLLLLLISSSTKKPKCARH